MDLRHLRGGELLAGFSAIGLLLAMFLEWFDGQSAWEALAVGRILLVAVVALALTLVVLTLTARPVAMAGSAASITVGVSALVLLYLFFRIVINEPGPDAGHAIGPGAYLGFVLVVGCAAGAWRALGDERTHPPPCARPSACSPSAAPRARHRPSATPAARAAGRRTARVRHVRGGHPQMSRSDKYRHPVLI